MLGIRSHLDTGSEAYQLGAAALMLSIAVILGALAFEHIGGLIPCPLCLQQRYAYYAGIPLIFGALILVSAGNGRAAGVIFFLVALVFAANAALGAYHAGVEWDYWPGPQSCAGTQDLATSTDDLVSKLGETTIVRCDEVAWSFLGLSLAGWNVVVSLLVFLMMLRAAFTAHNPVLKKSV